MKKFQEVFFPDHEVHLLDWMAKNGEIIDGRGSYQIKKLRVALSHCHKFRTAIDVGGHIGLWSMQLVKHFEKVEAFEPVAAHRECFRKNVSVLDGPDPLNESYKSVSNDSVTLHACALGDHEGSISISTSYTSSGDSKVAGDGDIPMLTMDSFNITDVDFIKLDCEGYEYFALRGGEKTIREYMPTIIVEQKPGRAQQFGLAETQAVEWLISLGYECVAKLSGDFVMVPK